MYQLSSKEKEILKIDGDKSSTQFDIIAIEEPLQITISGAFIKNKTGQQNIAVTMRTPGADQELAVGFLYGEGILTAKDQIRNVIFGENRLELELSHSSIDVASLQRNFYTTSSCGVCGKASIEAIAINKTIPTPTQKLQLDSDVIVSLPAKAAASQKLFHSTGGIHAASIFDLNGKILLQHEDVGRHNALDKVIGASCLENLLPLDAHILLLSGRASFELIQKAVMAGIQIVVAIGAPSSLAVELAEEYDVTLIGFLKEQSFNIYNGAHRIIAKPT